MQWSFYYCTSGRVGVSIAGRQAPNQECNIGQWCFVPMPCRETWETACSTFSLMFDARDRFNNNHILSIHVNRSFILQLILRRYSHNIGGMSVCIRIHTSLQHVWITFSSAIDFSCTLRRGIPPGPRHRRGRWSGK